MPSIRIVPGAVDGSSLRALILARRPDIPAVTLRKLADGLSYPFTLRPLPQSAAASQQLAAQGIQLYGFQATGLLPSTAYRLSATVGQESAEVPVETLPDDLFGATLTVALGSCYYDYFNKDADYLAALRAGWIARPAFKLLVGDNLYADIGPGKLPGSLRWWTGYTETVSRYVQYFWTSDYSLVLAYKPTFATSDDHEFWNNYPEEQPWLARTSGPLRQGYIDAGTECLRLFQYSLNPDPVVAGGGSFSFSIPPLSFFVADTRVNRTRHSNTPRRLFPDGELAAFEHWAANLSGPGVFVLGQPLWIETGSWKDYNPPDFEEQYARIWFAIATAPHDILVVSGDVHHSRLLKIDIGGPVYEFVTSPACHIPNILLPGQGRDTVTLPDHVPIDPRVRGALKPMLTDYVFGTDAPNSFGLLHFSVPALPGGRVAVGCGFIDIETKRPAAAVEAAMQSGSSIRPRFRECLDMNTVTLR